MKYEAMQSSSDQDPPLRVDFLVLPGASLMTLASAADPLRVANRVAGRLVFDWRFLSRDGKAPLSSAGIAWPVSGAFEAEAGRDVFAVIAGFRASDIADRVFSRQVYRASRAAPLTLGIESGAWLLARAGLLDGRAATTHWEDLEDFAAAFPSVEVRPERFVVDGPFLTTSGASPTLDLMLDLVGRRAGQPVALAVAGIFNYDIVRSANDRQVAAAFGATERHDPRIVRAVRIMETCIDRPITVAAVAHRVGLSARGLELLFRQEVNQSPGEYFLSLRLSAARKLLLDTRLAVGDIASRSGFSSLAGFSRAYRRAFSASPTESRRARAG